MDSKVAAIVPASEPGGSRVGSDARSTVPEAAPQAPPPEPVEMRLVIEQDPATGSYVYKTIDRATGEVLQQLPRAEVLKLKEDIGYAAGRIIRTEA
jgi:flagellar protein FlaG